MISFGRLFLTVGPATGKVRPPTVDRFDGLYTQPLNQRPKVETNRLTDRQTDRWMAAIALPRSLMQSYVVCTVQCVFYILSWLFAFVCVIVYVRVWHPFNNKQLTYLFSIATSCRPWALSTEARPRGQWLGLSMDWVNIQLVRFFLWIIIRRL